jgi:methylenetetrahydrofolate reductase (NADPH)
MLPAAPRLQPWRAVTTLDHVIQLIRDIHKAEAAAGRPCFSAEFFPPKTEDGERRLFSEVLPALRQHPIRYFSVTYGAGGTTREKTIGIVDRIQREADLTCMMHLTCVGATESEIANVVAEARQRGIRNLLALRGDPPPGSGAFVRTAGGFEYSRELVEFLKREGGFSIGTAGFPEGHIAQPAGKYVDWGHLAEKIQAGADFVVTQLFFDNADFYTFRDHLTQKLGVRVPIIPGILPVLARNQTKRFVEMCGARLPDAFLQRLDALGDDDAAVTDFGIEYCSRQIEDLLRQGTPGVHFYTLNRAHSTSRILQNLGY